MATKAEHKARVRDGFAAYKKCKNFTVKLVTGTRVIFKIEQDVEGVAKKRYEIDFEFKDGYLTMNGTRFLPAEQYAFYFSLADELMKAVMAGYKERSRKKPEACANIQPMLFNPADLPQAARR